jgi:F1F0 ATPase subunit 2
MNENINILLAFTTGLCLGSFFFGSLWFTVKKAISSKMPSIWFVSSFFFRTGITLIGFYYTTQGNWMRLLVCLMGFTIARFIVTYFTKSKEESKLQTKKEVNHET